MRRIRILAICFAATLVLGAIASASALATFGATAWGENEWGQLGNGTTTKSSVPVTVSNIGEVASVAAGWQHSLALLSSGKVTAWGLNADGELGNGTKTNSSVPVNVSGITEATAIAAGDGYSLALLANGTVVAWGANDSGQLGDGTTTTRTTPVAVSGLSEVASISAGAGSTYAVLENGTVKAWGANSLAELGNGSNTGPETCTFEEEALACSKTPVTVSGISEASAVAGGLSYGMALLASGKVLTWGQNDSGELGVGTETGPEKCTSLGEEHACSRSPVEVGSLEGVTAISAPGQYALALLSGGTVKSWGINVHGQLGNNTTANSSVPVAVSGLSEVAAISGGEFPGIEFIKGEIIDPGVGHSLALLANGTLKSWGANEDGQLGNGTNKESHVPVAISGFNEVAGISGGGLLHSLAYGAPGPTVGEIVPPSGSSSGGTTVEIKGTNFTGATAVTFGNVPATSFTVTSSTTIVATTPPAARPAKVHVRVTTTHGTSSPAGTANQFTYVGEGALGFGRCVKVAKGEGKYKTGSCTSLQTGGNFEWFPGVVKAKFTTSGGEATLETVGKSKVVCSSESGSGEYSGPKTVAGVTMTFKGCEGLSAKCSTAGQPEGTIVTKALEGVLGWEVKETNSVGLDLFPAEEGEDFVHFSCGSTPVQVRGSVIAAIGPVNNMSATFKPKYKATKGKQKPEQFEGGSPDVLEASIGEASFEQLGLAFLPTQTSEEELEINTFV